MSIPIPSLSYNEVIMTDKERKKTEHSDGEEETHLGGTENENESTAVYKQPYSGMKGRRIGSRGHFSWLKRQKSTES